MLDFGAINWLAVVVVTAVHQVLGYLWYGPLFGKTWMQALGKAEQELGSPTRAIAISVAMTLVMASALALLLTAAQGVNSGTGILFGLIAGLGFGATAAITRAGFEGTSPMVVLLAAVYQGLGLAIMGGILGAWR